MYWRYITSSIDRLLTCLDGLTEAELNWRPLAEANSLAVLAVHTLANAEQSILGVLCGQPVQRRRELEFLAKAVSPEPIQTQWRELRERLANSLAQVSPAELEKERDHPRHGRVTGREALLIVARHAAEHLAHAELTRDLLRAKINHE
jgi:DinB family protein